MNRRDFLKALGISSAAVAAPKFIFDLGANLWRHEVVYLPNELELHVECVNALREWGEKKFDAAFFAHPNLLPKLESKGLTVQAWEYA